jgi:beta-galactosidase
VIMWSIGNEIDYANDPFSHPVLGDKYRPTQPRAEMLKVYAEPLVAAVKKLDTTRPVTAALANLPMSNAVALPQCLDVVGYNYQEKYYEADHKAYPERVIFGSENGDSYDAWQAVVKNDYIAGQFLWTGIDYLGEAGVWPNRAAGAGLLDLCGFKKPVGWYRQSLWSDTPMVYACVTDRIRGRQNTLRGQAHWNWPVGQTFTVLAVTNCDAMTLELNGKSLERKSRDQAVQGVLSWRVPYEPGVLKAIGYEAEQAVCNFILTTTGAAHSIALIPDVTQLQASGSDICHLEFQVTDKTGQRIATAASEIRFEIQGPARLIGIGNGDLNDTKSNQDLVHAVYQGRGLAIVQSGFEPGRVLIRAVAEGLEPCQVELVVQ